MNLSAWSSVPEPSGESSILKIQAFLGRLKAVSSSNAAVICAEIKRFKLVKYQTEICDGMAASAARLKTSGDVGALVQVQSALHQSMGAPYSLLSVPKILKAVQATGRQRTLARLTLELYYNDLLPPSSSTALVSKMLAKLEPSGNTLKVLLAYPLGDLMSGYITRVEQWVQESEPQAKTDLMLSDEIQKIDNKKLELEEASRLCAEAKGERQPGSERTQVIVSSPSGEPGRPSGEPIVGTEAPPGATPPPKWSQYEQKLTTMSSAGQVEECVKSFSSDASTFTKTQSLLLEAPRVHMLKWYSLFLSRVPELAQKASPAILQRYENPTFLRYIAELVKVGVLRPEVAVDILIKLSTPTLKPQLCFIFSEACGNFLAQCDSVQPRLKSYCEFLRKQPASTHDRTLLDGTIEYLSLSTFSQPSDERSLAEFVKLLLYRELDKFTYPRVLKLVKKLKQGELLSLYSLFCDLGTISSETIPLVAKIIVQMSVFCPEFGIRVLNTLLSNMHVEKQLQISHAMMLGELQPLLVPEVIDHIFKGFLKEPGMAYRLKLASIFASYMRGLAPTYLDALKEYHQGVDLEVGSEIIALYEKAVVVLSSTLAPIDLDAEAEAEEIEFEEPEPEDEPDIELEVEPEVEPEEIGPDHDPKLELSADEDAEFMAAFAQASAPPSTIPKPNLSKPKAPIAIPRGLNILGFKANK